MVESDHIINLTVKQIISVPNTEIKNLHLNIGISGLKIFIKVK